MIKRFKLIVGIVIGVALILLAWQLLKAGDQEWQRNSGSVFETAPILYGALRAPEQKTFLQSQDSVWKRIAGVDVEYSQVYKSPRLNTDKWIISMKWTAGDSINTKYKVQVCSTPAGTYITLDSMVFDQTDSATTIIDTLLTSAILPTYNYLKYVFSGVDSSNKWGTGNTTGVALIWNVNVVADSYTYWIPEGVNDTTATVYMPALYSNWTLWYKYQHHDSASLRLKAIASYDGANWLIADSVAVAAHDTTLKYKSWSLPRALYYKAIVLADTLTPTATSDWDGNDSTAYMCGVMAKFWQVLAR